MFIDMRDDDDQSVGVIIDHAPQYPIVHMTPVGSWKWDEEKQRRAKYAGIHQTKYEWRYFYDGMIDADEQAYFLSISDQESL